MEEQNRVNEEKDREKLGEGAIWKMGTQGKIITKPKTVVERDLQEREGKKE